ncbi:23S rRNA (uracil(1939)-C(5))-methyltransferase RlmD [Neiella sp. HB171785]|uniref:23S rRNA (Uracil(1939)-C(5))-methyltransferase RlmD n=1 Tax=Neiella litorisoli TaxID=2771431 RepID=A0A8J6QUK9_9GAMM|nr:23S rRNA (uracil(1939)-C(5))-methyltransferase RlmD [Neiella litorisoli]MBD1390007.1 23S rRNA (uracil(1939)-C(5))-methyltransferase RlmD [Neiella litorisoli]
MANFFTPKKRQNKQVFQCQLNDLDIHGQGVGRWQQRVVFVAGGLPGETVQVQAMIPSTGPSKGPLKGQLKNISKASEFRQAAPCPHYQHCGGCQLQHLQADKQIEYKQQALQRMLAKVGVTIEQWQPAIHSPSDLGYRTKARLALDVRNRVKLGFRHQERQTVVPISQCPILAEPLQQIIEPLQQLLGQLSAASQVGHIELQLHQQRAAVWLHRQGVWSSADQHVLDQWSAEHNVQLLVQDAELSYSLDDFGVSIHYRRNHFIQSNQQVNERMVAQAIDWLQLSGTETVLDLFCGAGNFSLPLATKAAKVVGVEGVADMVTQAKQNAARNQLANIDFFQADLTQRLDLQPWWQPVDIIVLDPARAGAQAVVEQLPHCRAGKVLYISCNPTTLVRDAAILQGHGYHAEKAGVMDMFPHTHHLESMILFSKN